MMGILPPQNTALGPQIDLVRTAPLQDFENMPLDPALGGAGMPPTETINGVDGSGNEADSVPNQQPQDNAAPQPPAYPHISPYDPLQFDSGPHGDPFALQMPPIYYPEPTPDSPVHATRTNKRKRRVDPDPNCTMCGGDNSVNREGVPEPMLSCSDCGRSGHPVCLGFERPVDLLFSYAWTCSDCKKCEMCNKKSAPASLLFCDQCDKGWHMRCLQPPLEAAPEGDWFCPECVGPVPPKEEYYPVTPDGFSAASPRVPSQTPILTQAPPQPLHAPSPTPLRATSVASSSAQARAKPRRPKGRRKSKPVPIPTDESEEVDVKASSPMPVPRSSRKGKERARAVFEEETPVLSSPRPRKRAHVAQKVSASPEKALPRVRLRLGKKRGPDQEDVPLKGLFDDILSEKDRDVSSTSIYASDKVRFDRSLRTAERKLAPPVPPGDHFDDSMAGPSSRPLRSSTLQQHTPLGASESSGSSTPGAVQHPPHGLRIRHIRFGQFDIDTWYDAPFPEEYSNIPDGRMWICEFCLKYMKSAFMSSRHRVKCKARHPPGDEIYRDGNVSIFEVDGRKSKIYCQNLCLLSKMFLDHKSLFYDVEPFLFYVVAEVDDGGARFVGYFSKEKRSPKDYNVSCIMTLPVRQRQGWGNFLIDFSYLLSKKEQRLGSPEKPLSSLGALGYRNYWTLAVMRYLEHAPDHIRLEDISIGTSMTIEDVHSTLVQQNMISARDSAPPFRASPGQASRYSKGRRNGVARRALQRTQTKDKESEGPFVPPTQYDIHWDREQVSEYLRKWEAKGYLTLKPEKLKWSPFIVSRMQKTEGLMATSAAALATSDSQPTVADTPATEPATTASPDRDSVASSWREDEDAASSDDELPDTNADMQLERDRLLAEELANTPTRRLRNHSSSKSRTPVKEIRIPRSGKANGVVTPSRGIRTGTSTPRTVNGTRSRRSRRSPSTLPDHIEMSPPIVRPASSRKRRRIESSPEEATPPPSAVDDPEPEPEPAESPSMVIDGEQETVETQQEEFTGGQDVKTEDAGTPLTTLTSRQSIPSDDTAVFINGDVSAQAGSTPAEPEQVDLLDEDADGEFDIDEEV